MGDDKNLFFIQLARLLNSGQSRSVILCGNIHDLFWSDREFVPLIPFLTAKCATDGLRQIVYELNGPIRIGERDLETLRTAWMEWRSGKDADTLLLEDLRRKRSETDFLKKQFDQHLRDSIGNATLALEFLRQLTICSRARLRGNLLIVIEAADMLLPAGKGDDVASLNDPQLRRISIVQDWFGDPAFIYGGDSVCLIAESRSLIHNRVSRLPQVLSVEIAAPDHAQRLQYIEYFLQGSDLRSRLWSSPVELADFTAGLSIHALRQLLLGASYENGTLTPADVIAKVEQFIQAQLGEDVIEFKKPAHTLDDAVGFRQLKEFLREELIPRFRAKGDKALPGAAVAGPIGGGKTFLFEAVAAELGMPVLVLKNIRSQWFGQTDVIFERLRRVLTALEKVVIFVDEADTQFGGIDQGTHATERRLTGKIQAMMSDPQLRGKVIWLLMTARIHRLSPDIRRPGRVGDLIIPVLDPEGDDRREFIEWMLKGTGLAAQEPAEPPKNGRGLVELLDQEILAKDYSAAAFASLRSQIKAVGPASREELIELIRDQLTPAIGLTRRYQTLQALVNCTRRRLLPDPSISQEQRQAWELEIRELEQKGIH